MCCKENACFFLPPAEGGGGGGGVRPARSRALSMTPEAITEAERGVIAGRLSC